MHPEAFGEFISDSTVILVKAHVAKRTECQSFSIRFRPESKRSNMESSSQTYCASYDDEGKELVTILIQNLKQRVTVAKQTYPIKFVTTYAKSLMWCGEWGCRNSAYPPSVCVRQWRWKQACARSGFSMKMTKENSLPNPTWFAKANSLRSGENRQQDGSSSLWFWVIWIIILGEEFYCSLTALNLWVFINSTEK